MKRIILEGMLGEKFGREWDLDVKTPSEAMRAIEANRKGFLKYLLDSGNDGVGYQVMIGGREVGEDEVRNEFHFPFSTKEEFVLVPIISGSVSGGVKFVIGAVLLVAAIVLAAPTGGGSVAFATTAWSGGFMSAGTLAMMGVMLMASGVAAMMAPDPASSDSNTGENKASYLFNGAVNTTAQGGPVPIGYGRLIIGSVLISGGIIIDDISTAEGAILQDYQIG
jgi:predicted phage tail protein